MRKIIALCIPVLLVGCQGGDATPAASVPTAPVVAALGPPGTKRETQIVLINQGAEVGVGITAKNAFKVFPPPDEGDIGTEQLPPVFQRPYSAKSWETAGRGFGVVTYDDDVVAAMYEVDQVSDEVVDHLGQMYEARLASVTPEVITGDGVTYRFWQVVDSEGHGQRLMICAFRHDKGTDVTIAMGDDVVMDALGASKDAASLAVEKIREILAVPKPAPTTPANP